MSALAQRLSTAAYLEREDPRRTELLDGIVIVNEPTYLHQHVCGALFSALRAWTRGAHGRGVATLSLDLLLEEGNVLAPDVMWFAQAISRDAVRAPRPPDLAVEVRSPGTWAHDIGRKRALYERHNVCEVWLVDTMSESLLQFSRSTPGGPSFDIERELNRAQTLRSTLLAEFSLPLAELFEIG